MASTGPLAPPSVLVAGGTGFVGLSVCREAVSRGLGVVSVSRSGLAPERRTEGKRRVGERASAQGDG